MTGPALPSGKGEFSEATEGRVEAQDSAKVIAPTGHSVDNLQPPELPS
jgi:hypothetical protein